MSRSACPAHPDAPALASCSVCFVGLCDTCRAFDGMKPVCAACHQRLRRGPLVRGAIGLVALVAVGAGCYQAYRSYQPPYDYGRRAGEVGQLEVALAREPCDRQKAHDLLKDMLAAGNSRGVIERAAAFGAKCGDYPPLREQTYAAHQRLGELDLALADLGALIEHGPKMPYYRAWRATLYEEKGDFERAAEDLRQALSLYPAAVDLPQRLASIYERQGKPCDAVTLLQQLAFRYGQEAFAAGVRARVEGLEQQGACAAATAGAERVTLRADPRHGTAVAKVRVNDQAAGSFVVDTGASYLTLPRALAERLGLDLANAPKGKFATANGVREAQLVVVPAVTVGGLKAERVAAAVVDDLPGIDGLLGMSFLARFDLRQSGGVIELGPRPAPVAGGASAASPASKP